MFFDILKDFDKSLWTGAQIMVIYRSLNMCSLSNQIMG